MFEPKLYSKYNDCQTQDNFYVLNIFMTLIKWNGNDSVLDIGSGDGKFAVEGLVPRLPKTFHKFVGCDISEAMVKFARTTYKQPRVDFEHLDISTENIPPHLEIKFDHIFSFCTLHWVSSQRQAFTNMYNMLKPGGDILLTFLDSNPMYEVYLGMIDNIKWQPYTMPGSVSPYKGCQQPEKILEKMLVDVGFEVHVCRMEKRTSRYPSRDIFEKSIIAVNPLISEIPPDEVSDYVSEFMQHMYKLKCMSVEKKFNNEEVVDFEHWIFVVFASKPTQKL